ncbi:hypothetical protein [Nocardioides nitrophenolicus]|uniref:hypothetical protein n=1 Tax=Nocardioides nitrophenolicus TaxID=60489 RepID=UPI000A86942C|nr:hypothetical protein [Nocardioides nitrophenolicus]MBM7518302.1 hypothetical protein [Nocardioides nitrophenolicus]
MSKRHTSSDPTANAAVGKINRDGQIANDLRDRARLREEADAARNARLRRQREQRDASHRDGI